MVVEGDGNVPGRTAAAVTRLAGSFGLCRFATRSVKGTVVGHVPGTEEEENSIDSLCNCGHCSSRHGIPRVDPS